MSGVMYGFHSYNEFMYGSGVAWWDVVGGGGGIWFLFHITYGMSLKQSIFLSFLYPPFLHHFVPTFILSFSPLSPFSVLHFSFPLPHFLHSFLLHFIFFPFFPPSFLYPLLFPSSLLSALLLFPTSRPVHRD